MKEQEKTEQRKEDRVRISEEVIETIVGIAASEVEGVATLSGSFADGIAGVLGRRNVRKGVKVQVDGEKVSVDVSLVVEYGCRIHDVSKEIQNSIRGAVMNMTGMTVTDITVNVVGINIKDEDIKAKAQDGPPEDLPGTSKSDRS